jgi:hypothetical protein
VAFFSEGVNLGKYGIIWFLIYNSTSKARHVWFLGLKYLQ